MSLNGEVQAGHREAGGCTAQRSGPLQPNWPEQCCCSGWFVWRKCHAVLKRTRGFVKVTYVMSMYLHKSVQYVLPLVKKNVKTIDFFFLFFRRGWGWRVFCAFLRVALKDLHHTREAMSTAKSILALSVHKIAHSMKLDSGIRTTLLPNTPNRSIREQPWCCHTKTTTTPQKNTTWRNVNFLPIEDGRRIRLLT